MTLEYKVSADRALEMLKEGNIKYLAAKTSLGDISTEKRRETCKNGQQPSVTYLLYVLPAMSWMIISLALSNMQRSISEYV